MNPPKFSSIMDAMNYLQPIMEEWPDRYFYVVSRDVWHGLEQMCVMCVGHDCKLGLLRDTRYPNVLPMILYPAIALFGKVWIANTEVHIVHPEVVQ